MRTFMIKTRDKIPDILREDSIGCEIGVFEGEFAEQLLRSEKFKKLYLIDIFSGEANNFSKFYRDSSVLYDFVKNKFSNDKRVEVIKQDSISFLKSTNIQFDFIYIDTIHSYDFLIQELEAAHNIINNGGYICGHDYCATFKGVIQAVQEFIHKYQYSLILTEENNFQSFIIQINKI